MMTPPPIRSRSLGLLATLALLALLGAPRASAQLPERRPVNPRAVADSFAYRIATLDPTHGPVGTKVTVRWQSLPALTPVHLSLGALHVGFEVLHDVLTDQKGEFTDTIVIPDWAESTRPHALVVQDLYFAPLALSSDFLVTDKDGTLSRDGRIGEQTGRCPVLIGEDGDRYHLVGSVQGIAQGERATVRGTIADPAQCGGEKGVTLKITSVKKGFPG